MTIQDLRDKGLMLFEVISGSRAYGTHKPTSDTDYRGVYILPKENLYGFKYIEQVSDATNDSVYYEIGRFLQLLQTQNPNIIELYNMPEANIIYKHPLFDEILKHRANFISKVCRDSFGGYAVAQIQKARGLNKKIVNPMPKERKSILDFCHLIDGYNTISLRDVIEKNLVRSIARQGEQMKQENCGLVNIPHAKDVYALFYDMGGSLGYRGITNTDDTSNEVRLSSIPKGASPLFTMIYNKDGYTKYCKDYKEYWEWEEKKNQDRYNTNMEHGKGYDSKNMMHCIRLVRMATEIAELKQVIVKRPDAAELMLIRNGEMEYDALLQEAESKIKELDVLYANSDLPDSIDREFVNKLLIDFRIKFYGEGKS
jgi:hypothetical protein